MTSAQDRQVAAESVRRAGPVPQRAPTAEDRPSGLPGMLLGLQRQAGNRAVGTAIAARPTVQRFVGREHKELGDGTGRTVDLGNGVVLSWGDLVALAGDEYATLDDLLADTRDEAGKQRLLAAFRDDHIPDPAHSRLPEPTAEQKSDRLVTFLKLAAENTSHFNASGQAIDRWATDHTAAITAALDAGLTKNEAGLQLALAREAFAQHFLTDAFSGGHIRTPRPDIIGWYRANFGPPVVDFFISRMSERLIEGLVNQIGPQTNWPDFLVRRKVRAAVGARLATAIAQIDGGRAKLNDYFALAVAGVVSGAMHDLEGGRGVAVSSEAHPEPWTAFGDAKLGDSPVSKAQAELAIAAAIAHVAAAYEVGRTRGKAADPAHAPQVAYFAFDSADLSPATGGQLTAAAAYLHARPEMQVTLVGHTDPTGPDPYNETLGLRRANAVAERLQSEGVAADQIAARSEGERSLVTTVPGQFRLNRRVAFAYLGRPGPYRDPVRDEALAELRARIAPPYPDVTRFVPKPLAATNTSGSGTSSVATSQVELDNWRWGSIPTNLRGEIDTWIRGYGPMITAKISAARELNDDRVEGYDIHPRPLVEAIVRNLLGDPSGFLEEAFGRPMSP
ncbi:OmpA family protein [Nocardia sp. NPDC050710]|uniref:OmpA family protein n=1 Tax=Nocardia sp. NPDC050710 TaxID=3157220 RepID=UPI0033FF4A3F